MAPDELVGSGLGVGEVGYGYGEDRRFFILVFDTHWIDVLTFSSCSRSIDADRSLNSNRNITRSLQAPGCCNPVTERKKGRIAPACMFLSIVLS